MKKLLVRSQLMLSASLPAQVINFAATTRAVVVGISDYQEEKIPDLPFADQQKN